MTEFTIPAVVPADPDANITDLLVERVKETPNRALFAVPDGSGWRDITAAQFHEQVIALAKGLVAAGIEPGDKVGFIARTTYDWTLVDFALFFAGAVMVPIYETSSSSQIACSHSPCSSSRSCRSRSCCATPWWRTMPRATSCAPGRWIS